MKHCDVPTPVDLLGVYYAPQDQAQARTHSAARAAAAACLGALRLSSGPAFVAKTATIICPASPETKLECFVAPQNLSLSFFSEHPCGAAAAMAGRRDHRQAGRSQRLPSVRKVIALPSAPLVC